jgi:hypothetical protein
LDPYIQNQQAIDELAQIPGASSTPAFATLQQNQETLRGILKVTTGVSQQMNQTDTSAYTTAAKSSLLSLQHFLHTLSQRLPVITIIAALFSCTLAVWMSVQGVLAFQRTQRTIRQGGGGKRLGPKRWHPQQWTVSLAMKFCGLQTGSAIFGFLLAFVTMLVFLFLLSWGEFWKFLLTLGGPLFVPVSVVLAILQDCFLESYIGDSKMSNRYCMQHRTPCTIRYTTYTQYTTHSTNTISTTHSTNAISTNAISCRYWITDRRAWTLYSVFMIVLSVITGMFFAVPRFLCLFVFSIASISRLDYSLFPDRYISEDKGFSSYMALQMLTHRHQSPVLHAFARVHFDEAAFAKDVALQPREDVDIATKAAEEGGGEGCGRGGGGVGEGGKRVLGTRSLIVRNRWHLAYSLVNNPSIIGMRRGWGADDTDGNAGATSEGARGRTSDDERQNIREEGTQVENPVAAAVGIEMTSTGRVTEDEVLEF